MNEILSNSYRIHQDGYYEMNKEELQADNSIKYKEFRNLIEWKSFIGCLWLLICLKRFVFGGFNASLHELFLSFFLKVLQKKGEKRKKKFYISLHRDFDNIKPELFCDIIDESAENETMKVDEFVAKIKDEVENKK